MGEISFTGESGKSAAVRFNGEHCCPFAGGIAQLAASLSAHLLGLFSSASFSLDVVFASAGVDAKKESVKGDKS